MTATAKAQLTFPTDLIIHLEVMARDFQAMHGQPGPKVERDDKPNLICICVFPKSRPKTWTHQWSYFDSSDDGRTYGIQRLMSEEEGYIHLTAGIDERPKQPTGGSNE